MKKLVLTLAILLVSSVALAQAGQTVSDDTFNVTATVPDGWEVVTEEDRAVFNFRNEDHSQIEIIGNELIDVDAAGDFFNHFHETLQSSDFTRVGQEDKTYGEFAGSETIYRFEHSGIALKVAVFQFVREETAWLVVAYMQEEVFDTRAEEFRGVVGNLAFGE